MSNYYQDRANKEGKPIYVGPNNVSGGSHWVYPQGKHLVKYSNQLDRAFEYIAKANTVSVLSLNEMQAIVMRALNGEFDEDVPGCSVCGNEERRSP